jgi:hypothetical protein
MNWRQTVVAWDFFEIEHETYTAYECKVTWGRWLVTMAPYWNGTFTAELQYRACSEGEGSDLYTVAYAFADTEDAAFASLLKQFVGPAERVTVAGMIAPADFDLGGIE